MSPASFATARKIVRFLRAFERRADPFHRSSRDARKAMQKAMKPSKPRSKGNHLSGPRPTDDHRMPHSTTKDPA